MRLNLSSTKSGQKWTGQFSPTDRPAAERLLNYILLISEANVGQNIQNELSAFNNSPRRVALYAERELVTATAFPIETYIDGTGRSRRRAVGNAKFQAVRPKRGATRVGSEGWIAFLISQAVKSNTKFVNSPSPNQYKSKVKTNRIRDIVIVTDFIASGNRIHDFLDGFWKTPTFRSWWSRRWIRFHVVAAAATTVGIRRVNSHPCKPTIRTSIVCQVLSDAPRTDATAWTKLAIQYGPDTQPLGYDNTGALIAFQYGFPNNAPAILASKFGNWRPLFAGRSPPDMHELFTGQPHYTTVFLRLMAQGFSKLRDGLDISKKRRLRIRNTAFLAAIRGRWHKDSEIEIASRSGLDIAEVLAAKQDALGNGWITARGRVTDAGRRLLNQAARTPSVKPQVADSDATYYPRSLRVP